MGRSGSEDMDGGREDARKGALRGCLCPRFYMLKCLLDSPSEPCISKTNLCEKFSHSRQTGVLNVFDDVNQGRKAVCNPEPREPQMRPSCCS